MNSVIPLPRLEQWPPVLALSTAELLSPDKSVINSLLVTAAVNYLRSLLHAPLTRATPTSALPWVNTALAISDSVMPEQQPGWGVA
jgi:hypothetical protein